MEHPKRELVPPYKVVLVALLALAVRGAFVAARYEQLSADPDGYRAIARELRATGRFARSDGPGEAFPTAYRPPLYPLLLAAVGTGKRAAATLHVILGVATVVGTFLLARRLGLTHGAWAAALLVCFDPLLLNQSALVMTETLAAALTLAAVAALAQWSDKKTWHWAAIAGAAIGLCALCRPTYLVWLLLVAAAALVRLRGTGLAMPRRQALVLAAVAALVLSPWAVRNALVFGRPIFATTHGGYTLLLGNNPYFYRYLHERWWTDAWHADEFDFRWMLRRSSKQAASWEPSAIDSPAEELADDAAAYAWARETIHAAPGDFALSAVYRWCQLASPLPSRLDRTESWRRAAARYAVATWYVALYALAAVGLWRAGRQHRPFVVWSALLIAGFFAVHTFYWANLRMRAPLMPVVCLVAGMGAERWLNRKRGPTMLSLSHPTAD